jgi:2-polyprenyl-3-methyl-5-hydroxy-6-metoxy-1,4-benzoquinol methylase
MKIPLLHILSCPICHSSLKFEGSSSAERIIRGHFQCLNGHLFQVTDEIPILKDQKLSSKEFTWKVEFPNLQRYEEIQRQYASYLSEEQKEADKLMTKELVDTVSSERLVLDIASGMGRLLIALSKQMGKETEILGTDIDETPLRGAKLKLEEEKMYANVSLCVMDGKHLAIKPQTLSCVTSYFGLDNIPDTIKALKEIARIMKRDGRLVMTTLWLKEGSKSLALSEKHGYGAISTRDRLVETLESTGFKLDSEEVFYSGKWPHNPMDLIPVEGDWFAHVLVIARNF